MQRLIRSHMFVFVEFVMLMIALPLLFMLVLPLRYMPLGLWGALLYCIWIWHSLQREERLKLWDWQAVNLENLRPILLRFAFATAVLTALTWFLVPEFFLGFVRTRPIFWAIVMVLYPLLSALPQEMIYRVFFFRRYSELFATPITIIIASAVLFAGAHLVFQNWVSPLLCLAGGLLFARTYHETRSLALVSLEHALYGCMIFTLGLGRYFYHGAVAAH